MYSAACNCGRASTCGARGRAAPLGQPVRASSKSSRVSRCSARAVWKGSSRSAGAATSPASAPPGPAPTAAPWPPPVRRTRRQVVVGSVEPACRIASTSSGTGERSTSRTPRSSSSVSTSRYRSTASRSLTHPQRQVRQRELRPEPGEVDPVPLSEFHRLGGMLRRLGRPALPGLQPGESGERGGQLRGLTELASQPDRLGVVGLGVPPAVRAGGVPGEVEQQAGQGSQGGLGPTLVDRLADQVPPAVGVPQEQRTEDQERRVVDRADRPAPVGQLRHPGPQQRQAVLAGYDPGHPRRQPTQRPGIPVGGLQQNEDPFGHRQPTRRSPT